MAQFLPRHGPEITEREAVYMLTEMNHAQQHRGHGATGSRSDGGPLDAHLRTAPATEDQGIVAQNVQHIDHTRHHHRIDHLVGTPQRGREGERQGLKERQGTGQPQIDQSVGHQLGPQSHQQQDGLGIKEQQCADHKAKHQVDHQRHAHHLHQPFAEPGPDILGTEDGGSHREELIDEEYQRDELVVESDGSHAVVAIAAEHDGVDGTEQHDECHFDEHRDGEHLELSFQRVGGHILILGCKGTKSRANGQT